MASLTCKRHGIIIGKPAHPNYIPRQIKTQENQSMYDPSWITIPSGSFRMGSDPADDVVPYDHETPLHRVHVDAFQLARTHVTNA